MFRRHVTLENVWAEEVSLVGIGLALMGWLAPQVWSFQGSLPITPQSLLVVLWPLLWGWRTGTASVVLYLLVGGAGLPVFADGAHGWQHFTGSTGGFLLAFPMAAVVVGWLAEGHSNMKYAKGAGLLLLGQLTIVVLGLMWQRALIPVEASWWETMTKLFPAILVKCALGTLVVVFVGRLLTSHKTAS